MKIILNENQYSFLRRYNQIMDLIDLGIKEIRMGDICEYTYNEFLTEVCWQVSDNMDDSIPVDQIHSFISRNLNDHIRNKFDEYIELDGCNDGFDDLDDDEDYLSGLLFGVDNN